MNIFLCYKILGLKPGASSAEVRIAYRDLVKVWHPDRFIHDPRLRLKASEKIKEINEAYNELSSFLKRFPEHYQKEESWRGNQKPQSETGKYHRDGNCKETGSRRGEYYSNNIIAKNICLLLLVIVSAPTFGISKPNKANSSNNAPVFKIVHPLEEPGKMIFAVDKQNHAEKLLVQKRYDSEPVLSSIVPKKSAKKLKPTDKKIINQTVKDNNGRTANLKVSDCIFLGSSPLGSGIQDGGANLTVENGAKEDALVKVKKVGKKDQIVRNFYLPSGESFTATNIPPGEYKLKVAFGTEWDNTSRKFNSNRSFAETELFFIHERRAKEKSSGRDIKNIKKSDVQIYLYTVKNNNYRAFRIDEKNFNQ